MNTDNILKLDVSWINNYILFTLVIFLISTLLKVAFSQQKSFISDAGDLMFILLKTVGCTFFAGYIYVKVITQESQEIDVMSFFTFMIAIVEAAHCMSHLVFIPIKRMINLVYTVIQSIKKR